MICSDGLSTERCPIAHIDGRIPSNPAQYVRRPQVHPSNTRGLDRSELGVFLFTAERYDREHAALAVLLGLNGLRVSEACATNVEDLGFERGHRTLQITGKGNKPGRSDYRVLIATGVLVPRFAVLGQLAPDGAIELVQLELDMTADE